MNPAVRLAPGPQPASWGRFLRPRPLRDGWRQVLGFALALCAVGAIGAFEVGTPPDVSFGALLLVVVLMAAWLVSVPAAMLVTLAALAVPVIARRFGSDSPVVSEVEIVAVIAVSAAVHGAIRAIERYQELLALHSRELSRINAGLERFTVGAAHELRAPLAVVQAEVAQAVGRATSPEELRQHLATIGTEIDRMSRSVTTLLTLARADMGVLQAAFRRVDLVDLLELILARWSRLYHDKQVDLVASLPEVGEITCDPDLLVRLLDNLLENALRAVGGGGRVELSAASARGRWLIVVRDDGPGIDTRSAAKVLEGPVIRHVSPGFGLALCGVIARSHGGLITVDNEAPGTVFRIQLPQASG